MVLQQKRALRPRDPSHRQGGTTKDHRECSLRGKRNRNNGFSLVELSMALALTAVLAAMSAPFLSSSMRSMQLESDARSIASTMRYAKLGASSQMTRYRVSFALDSNQWRLEKRNRTTGLYELQQANNELSSGIANSGIAFKGTSSSAPAGFPTTSSTVIEFDTRGVPTAGVGIVYLSNDMTNFAISVSLAGKVQFWRQEDGAWTAR